MSSGRRESAQTLENIQAVRQSVLQSATRSAQKHASPLGLSDRSFRITLHTDLKFHPYKLMSFKQLQEGDWGNRMACCDVIFQNTVLLTSD